MRVRDLMGLARSLAVYHGNLPKRRRGIALYRQFVRPGELVFDIGAHVGGRTAWFRSLGARVVAVEPSPQMLVVLRLLYGRDRDVALVPAAVGREAGSARLHVSTGNPMLATLAADWVREAATTDGFREIVWDRAEDTEVTTLDRLIEAHGDPAFCKIDVEAAEADVLAGLHRPVRALSFEFINGQQTRADPCLDMLDRLGDYEYALSFAESFVLTGTGWGNSAAARHQLATLPAEVGSGDIYARLRTGRPASQ